MEIYFGWKKWKTKYFRLPAWSEEVFYPDCDMEKVTRLRFRRDTSTKLMARLKHGFLIRDILERFTMKKDSTLSPDRSLHIYSAHDTTLANVINSLGLLEVSSLFLRKLILNTCVACLKRCSFYHWIHSRCTFHMQQAYFLSFTNPMATITSRFSTNSIMTKTMSHPNHFSYQIVERNVH